MTTALELRDLALGYESQIASGINLIVEPGEIVAITGPSGCGKSTLLLTVLGALPALGGSVLVNDKAVTDLPIHERGIGVVFQEPLLFPHLNVLQNVAYGLRNWSSSDAQLRTSRLMELAEITELAQRSVDQLSGGQAQRVALVRALAPSPAVLLLDEPMSALDTDLRTRLGEDIRALLKTSNTAAIYVTHDLDEAARVADRVLKFVDLATWH